MDPVRVLVADDHPLFRAGLRGLLDTRDGVEVVGEASTAEEAVAIAVRERPDVVVMDLHLPGVSGVEATRRISAAVPAAAVLVLTMVADDASVLAAVRAGARGYLLKGAGQAEIVHALEAVARGEAVFGPGVARAVLDGVAGTGRASTPPFPGLTDREREVLELLARGEQNAAIARRLGVSPKTVRNHVSNLLAKLQVADRSQAALRARDAGLGRGRP